MKTAIVILNYNDFENTKKYIEELKDYDILDKILVVDNCSTTGDYQKLKVFENDKIEVIQSEKNGGYSYGNNFGFTYLEKSPISYDYLIISNTDINVSENAIKQCIDVLEEDEKIAIAAPRMLYQTGEARRSAWKKRTFLRDLIHSSRILELLFYAIWKNGEYTKEEFQKPRLEVDCISGAFFVARQKALKEVYYFDENVFLFYEEDILSHKLKQAGYTITSVNTVSFMHYESQTIGKVFNLYKKQKILDRSKIYFQKTYNKISAFQVFFLKCILAWRKIELIPEIMIRKLIAIIKKRKKIEKMLMFFIV